MILRKQTRSPGPWLHRAKTKTSVSHRFVSSCHAASWLIIDSIPVSPCRNGSLSIPSGSSISLTIPLLRLLHPSIVGDGRVPQLAPARKSVRATLQRLPSHAPPPNTPCTSCSSKTGYPPPSRRGPPSLMPTTSLLASARLSSTHLPDLRERHCTSPSSSSAETISFPPSYLHWSLRPFQHPRLQTRLGSGSRGRQSRH